MGLLSRRRADRGPRAARTQPAHASVRVSRRRAPGAVRHAERSDRVVVCRGRAVRLVAIRRGVRLFMAANLWLPLSSGQYEGIGRYCAVLFPFFIWLATLESRAVLTAVLVVSAMLYTLCLALFTTIHPLF